MDYRCIISMYIYKNIYLLIGIQDDDLIVINDMDEIMNR